MTPVSRGERLWVLPGRNLVASLFLALAVVLVPAATAFAQTTPSGNNGTVKIHEGGLEPSPETRNQPHVCTFHLHFFFADAAQSGTWWIKSWPPTGNGTIVLSGAYLTDADGEFRAPPAPGAYDLPDGHYKLFWEGGSTTNVKHKVFWVDCGAEQGGAGGQTGGTTAGQVHVTAQVKASLRAEIRAQQTELSALASLAVSLRAEIGAENAAMGAVTVADVRASLTAMVQAQQATLQAIESLRAAIRAEIQAEQTVLRAHGQTSLE